jgi:hypothetical protein
MGLVYNALGNLNNLDFFNILLPFVLFLAITYGLLSKVNLFGGKGDKINAVISIAIAFFAVNYTTQGARIGEYLTKLFGSGSLAIATILLFIIALQLFGIKLESLGIGKADIVKWGLVAAVLAIGFFSFFSTGYRYGFGGLNIPFIGGFSLSNDLITTLAVLAIIGGAVWLIPKSEGGGESLQGIQYHEARYNHASWSFVPYRSCYLCLCVRNQYNFRISVEL